MMEQNIELKNQNEVKVNDLIELKNIDRKVVRDGKVKIDISRTQYRLVKTVASGILGWKLWSRDESKDDINVIWTDHYITQQFLKKLKPYQRVNHFPGSHQLGRKDCLANNLNNAQKYFPKQYNFYPKTWTLPGGFSDLAKFGKDHPSAVYIVKPGSSSQGKGIYITKQLPSLTNNDIIVQQYIQQPLLIENHKFDLRLYVLVRSLSPLKIYLYREGITRLATHTYNNPSEANIKDNYMHLTNYAINKNSPLYQSNQSQQQDSYGHKRSYTSTLKLLDELHYNTSKLQSQINDLIIKTILSIHNKLLECYRNSRQGKQEGNCLCFQIYGFDIMINSNIEAKLIQVNHSPSFQATSPLDLTMKQCLILDTLSMLGIANQQKINYLKRPTSQMDHYYQLKDKNYYNCNNNQEALGGYKQIYPSTNTSYEVIMKKLHQKTIKPYKRSLNFKQQPQIDLDDQLNFAQTLNKRKFRPNNLPFLYYLGDSNQHDDCEILSARQDKKNSHPAKISNINITFYGKVKPIRSFLSNRQIVSDASTTKAQGWYKQKIYQTDINIRFSKQRQAKIRIYKKNKQSPSKYQTDLSYPKI